MEVTVSADFWGGQLCNRVFCASFRGYSRSLPGLHLALFLADRGGRVKRIAFGFIVAIVITLSWVPRAAAATISLTWGPDPFAPSGPVLISKPSAGVCSSTSILASCSEFTYI